MGTKYKKKKKEHNSPNRLNRTIIMMNMLFNIRTKGKVLFEFWNVQNIYEYVATCIFILFLAIFYEWLSDYRTYFNTYKAPLNEQIPLIQHTSPQLPNENQKFDATKHFMKTILHMIQLTVSYLIMLIAMTYNVGYFCCIIVGAGIGYYLFGRLRARKPHTVAARKRVNVASCHPAD